MIQVTLIRQGQYKVKTDKPDSHVLQRIAEHFAITSDAALTAIIYRGIDSLNSQIEHEEVKDTGSHGCPHSGG